MKTKIITTLLLNTILFAGSDFKMSDIKNISNLDSTYKYINVFENGTWYLKGIGPHHKTTFKMQTLNSFKLEAGVCKIKDATLTEDMLYTFTQELNNNMYPKGNGVQTVPCEALSATPVSTVSVEEYVVVRQHKLKFNDTHDYESVTSLSSRVEKGTDYLIGTDVDGKRVFSLKTHGQFSLTETCSFKDNNQTFTSTTLQVFLSEVNGGIEYEKDNNGVQTVPCETFYVKVGD